MLRAFFDGAGADLHFPRGDERGYLVRVDKSTHRSRPWRIHEIAGDFRLEDVWALPTPGGPDDFPRLVEGMTSFDPGQSSSRAARLLWTIRWKLGDLLKLDEGASFQPLYRTDDEYATEIVNRTVHGILHLGWVPDESGDGYHGEMAVYVKPNGLLGQAYMATIRPFRHRIVYPAMLREIGQRWGEGRRS